MSKLKREYDKLLQLTTEMREAQKEYLKTRSSSWLQESQTLEKKVDKFIEDRTRETNYANNQKLF